MGRNQWVELTCPSSGAVRAADAGHRARRRSVITPSLAQVAHLELEGIEGVVQRLAYGLAAVLASGAAFAAFEIWRAPVWLLQLRGAVTLLKILLLVCVGLFWDYRIPLLVLITVLAVVSSHMPGRYRYYSPLLGRVLTAGHKG